MAKQIEGVAERIIDAAKKEFLDKGYVDASLRTIAAAAKKNVFAAFFFQFRVLLPDYRFVIIPEIGKSVDDREHLPPEIGQTVFHPRRHFAVVVPIGKTVFGHFA